MAVLRQQQLLRKKDITDALKISETAFSKHTCSPRILHQLMGLVSRFFEIFEAQGF